MSKLACAATTLLLVALPQAAKQAGLPDQPAPTVVEAANSFSHTMHSESMLGVLRSRYTPAAVR